MVKYFFSFIFLSSCISSFLVSLATLALEDKSLRTIETKVGFQTVVASPEHLTVCGGRLWTYSVSQKSLMSLDLVAGTVKTGAELPPGSSGDLSALTCQQDRLLVLINNSVKESSKKNRPQILEYRVDKANGTAQMIKTFEAAKDTRATDFFCNFEKCWLLQGQLYASENLKHWQLQSVPPIREVPMIRSQIDLNPFENWQSSLIMAKGKYLKGAVNSAGMVALLDPFHFHVVVRRTTEWEKWGSFGVWEGNFLSPKNLAFISKDVLAVTDAQLHAVFLFRPDGHYLGIVALSSTRLFSPLYPLGIVSVGQRLFVADFVAGKVSALDLSGFQSEAEADSELAVRQNLLRRADLPEDSAQSLCLRCHDGTQSNQLHKFVKSSFHHPLACSRCHDPHHQVKTRHYLRKEPNALCIECHKDHAKPETNHVWAKGQKKGGICLDCHRSHSESPKLLVEQSPKICIDCHREQSIDHRSVKSLLSVDRASGLRFENTNMSCTTCHQTHLSWRSEHFVKETDKVQVFCASCHGLKAKKLFSNFHQIMKSKGRVK